MNDKNSAFKAEELDIIAEKMGHFQPLFQPFELNSEKEMFQSFGSNSIWKKRESSATVKPNYHEESGADLNIFGDTASLEENL